MSGREVLNRKRGRKGCTMKFAVCNEIFKGKSWEDTCRFAAETGFDGVEIASITFEEKVTDISPETRAAIRKTAEGNGLEIAALHMLMSPPSLGMHINSPDAAVREKTAEYLTEIIRFAHDVGAGKMIYGSPFSRNVSEGLTYRQARDYMKQGLLSALDLAAEKNVILCVEPLPADCTDLFTTVEAACAFVFDVDHPSFGLMVDCKAMSTEVRPIEKTIRLFGPYIRHVHANDANSQAPGFGRVDYAAILQALKDVGYDDYVSLEPFRYKPDAETVVPVSLKYLRSCLPA